VRAARAAFPAACWREPCFDGSDFEVAAMLKKIALGLALALLAFVGFVASRPSTYRVERTSTIAAPAERVFAQLDDFRAWAAWSPWEKLDPNMKKTFSGPERGKGASYAWQGSGDVGKGKMTIVEHHPPTHVGCKLEFIEPFTSTARTDFSLSANADGSTLVTWSMDGQNDFLGKLFGVFMDMDAMIGADYEKGLAQLKTVVEGAPAP
jgi:hypothetical protein